MANKFAPGDVVQLVSGGPAMTIDKVPGDPAGLSGVRTTYAVVWFKGATSESGAYAEHLLKAFVAPK